MLKNGLGFFHPMICGLFFSGCMNGVVSIGGESTLATKVEHVLEAHLDVLSMRCSPSQTLSRISVAVYATVIPKEIMMSVLDGFATENEGGRQGSCGIAPTVGSRESSGCGGRSSWPPCPATHRARCRSIAIIS